MASAAEQLAASINFGAISKATELKKRLWFTFGALIIYRLGTYIPLPGIDPVILEDIFSRQAGGIIGIGLRRHVQGHPPILRMSGQWDDRSLSW